jgi:CHASE2 domain-containing sensor protein
VNARRVIGLARRVIHHRLFRPALGAFLAVLCGLVLWGMPLGDRWINASYDYLFRFGARTPTNNVVLVLMDSAAHNALGQIWNQPWNRDLHTQLLKKLTQDQCPLVVFDVFFDKQKEEDKDSALAEAMRRQGHVILASRVVEPKHPETEMAQASPPLKLFLDAAAGCGIGKADGKIGGTPRRHWPFPASSEGEFLSLPRTAARLVSARLDDKPQYQWLRYYAENGAWAAFSYHFALSKSPGYFRDKRVFIGKTPRTPIPGDEEDEFSTPYTRWNGGKSVGGVEIMATEFLNLLNRDWLRRPPWGLELFVVVTFGVVLGGGLCLMGRVAALGVGAAAALAVTLAAASLSHLTNYWFPWLVIVGGQVPCALACALARRPMPVETRTTVIVSPAVSLAPGASAPAPVEVTLPDAPDYELFHPPFGHGAYGKVWLARNAIGQWQALKAVYLANFGANAGPYEREFSGIRRYKPISHKHPSLLRIDFISKKKSAGYFYYVMELGDSLQPGWEENPSTYMPRDLARVRAQAEGRRLSPSECLRIGLSLAEALDFLHRQGLTHRDIKPQNIIFVNGQPKLGDVGLVADLAPAGKEPTYVGTPGYMPPLPEPPGTPQADIYGLGMLLYVILTGREADFFPEVATTLLEQANPPDFRRVNNIILKACDPDRAQRFTTAEAMVASLREAQAALSAANSAAKL